MHSFLIGFAPILFSVGVVPCAMAQSNGNLDFDIRNAAFVQIDKNDPLILKIDSDQIDPVKRQRRILVTRSVQQIKTRIVTINGQQMKQDFTRLVPFTEEITQKFSVKANESSAFAPFSLHAVKCWDSSGRRITTDDLAKLGSKPIAMILLREPWEDNTKLAAPQKAVIRADTLFLYVEEAIWRESRKNEEDVQD